MALRQRYQNPTVNDTVRLRLLVFNANTPENLLSVDCVSIYYLDPAAVTCDNPTGKILVETINGTSVVNDAPGSYYLDLALTSPKYVIGKYIDSWGVTYEENTDPAAIEKNFNVYPRLWYTTTIPVVYDFDFRFQPNKIVQGSKKWVIIEIIPNVPTANALEAYYTNVTIGASLSISIASKCDPCAPQEQDLRTIVENDPVEQREGVFGYYWLDTTEMEGLYDVWFTLEIGGNTYVSDRQQLLINC